MYNLNIILKVKYEGYTISIYDDKTQDNKSQLISSANTIYQNKSDENATLQLVDNRVEAVAQRELQDTINSSPRATQLKAFQDMADNRSNSKAIQLQELANNYTAKIQMKAKLGINDDVSLEKEADVMGAKALQMKKNYLNTIETKQAMDYNNASALQLKALAAGKLNVVGENHKDSAKRRNSEKAIANRVVGGGYWRENEFYLGKEKNFLKLFYYKGMLDYGDSLVLLVDMHAASLVEFLEYLHKGVRDYTNITERERVGIMQTIHVFYNACDAVYLYNQRIKDDSEKKFNLVKDVSILKTMLKAIENRQDVSIYSGIKEATENIKKHLKGRSSGDISKERSLHMDSSAEFDTKIGVWKVGDDHIEHIKEVKKGNYEILSKDEFNTEYSNELKDD